MQSGLFALGNEAMGSRGKRAGEVWLRIGKRVSNRRAETSTACHFFNTSK
jgi:hypothetical protein